MDRLSKYLEWISRIMLLKFRAKCQHSIKAKMLIAWSNNSSQFCEGVKSKVDGLGSKSTDRESWTVRFKPLKVDVYISKFTKLSLDMTLEVRFKEDGLRARNWSQGMKADRPKDCSPSPLCNVHSKSDFWGHILAEFREFQKLCLHRKKSTKKNSFSILSPVIC